MNIEELVTFGELWAISILKLKNLKSQVRLAIPLINFLIHNIM